MQILFILITRSDSGGGLQTLHVNCATLWYSRMMNQMMMLLTTVKQMVENLFLWKTLFFLTTQVNTAYF